MSATAQQITGFDAPVFDAKDDHLNRWPLARQIYNVAANGPADWSARIGVYGEWGTGKTSVLKFVSAMAKAEGHIVVWFDPWGYSSKPDLWHAFVMKCCDEIEESLGGITTAGTARRKSYFKKARDLLGKGVSAVPGDYGTIASGALDLLKGSFAFGPKDLKKLLADLNGKRVIVLIDDLDRTAAELVPEILYALKEVMDIPGFSFICGFDPVVVGEVLGAAHKGFGDGLKFLEKIIDYPVWLPPATADGLMKIAMADRSQHCDFVLVDDVRITVPLLPQNPRAIRQFIRLLALLKSQVDRYHPWELKWSVILASSVIKIRHPRLAPQLLGNREFWRGLSMTEAMEERSDDKRKIEDEITKHIERCEKGQSVEVSESERMQIHNCMSLILRSLNSWSANDLTEISLQMAISEAPQAVTWKEFDACVKGFCAKPDIDLLKVWIVEHAKEQHCREADVAMELSMATIERYRSELQKADDAFTARDKGHHRKQAKLLLRLLEALVLKLGNAEPHLGTLDWLPLNSLLQDVVPLAGAVSAVHRELWPRTEAVLVKLVKNWCGDLNLLIQSVRSIHPFRSARMEGGETRRVALHLNALLDNRLGKLAAAGFGESGFVGRVCYRREGTWALREVMLNMDGALWTTEKATVFATLRQAKRNATVRENAYSFLEWIEYLLRTDMHSERELGKRIAGDPEIMPAIWAAATASPFEGRYAYRLRKLPDQVKELGVELGAPAWWQPAIDKALAVYEKQAEQNKAADGEAGS
jgi:hypothetical protein